MGMSNYVLDQEEKAFAAWMAQMDTICVDKLSAPSDCLPDTNWGEMFSDGYSPQEAFEAYHEEQFGDSWENINGRFGVGA